MRISDWSSDVCSSDLIGHVAQGRLARGIALVSAMDPALLAAVQAMARAYGLAVLGSIEKPLTVEKLRTLLGNWDERLHGDDPRSEEHTSELQSLMRISYAVFCLKKKKQRKHEFTEHIAPQ